MATVYLAIQESFGRKVALKVMTSKAHDDNSYSDRFLREAKIVARLSHPHIVPVYDVGTADDYYYISMEYLDNGDLSSKIKQGLTLKQIIKVTKDVALALDYAHRKGIIHRDVKPDNIMFREDGAAVLTDFGIARPTAPDSNMTQVGKVIGTPKYMSPEQTKGEPLDNTCDLYALGIMLFELLTGNVPFDGNNPFEIGIKHLKEPIPRLKPGLSAFQELIDKLLTKNKTHRLQTGHDVIEYLDNIQEKLATSLNKKTVSPKTAQTPDNTKTQIQESAHSMRADLSDRNQSAPETEKKTISASFITLVLLLAILSITATVWYAPGFAPDNAVLMQTHKKLLSVLQPEPVNENPVVTPEVIPPKPAEPPKGNLVQKNLNEAKVAIALGNYATPEGESALDYYRKVLAIDVDNLEAKLGIADIASKLVTQTNESINSGNLEKAHELINKTKSISLNIPGLSEAESLLRQREQEILDSQKRAEIAAQAALEKQQQEKLLKEKQEAAKKEKLEVATKPQAVKSEVSNNTTKTEDTGNKTNALFNKVRINGLLAKADTYYSRGDYHNPSQESALGKYLEVLTIDPGNLQARQGVDKVVNVMMSEIRDKLLAQEYNSAQAIYNKAINASPNNTSLQSLGRSKGW
jgi:serine/threonine-protein kinase PpkA